MNETQIAIANLLGKGTLSESQIAVRLNLTLAQVRYETAHPSFSRKLRCRQGGIVRMIGVKNNASKNR